MEAFALLLWHTIHGIGMILLFFSFEDFFFPGHRCGVGGVLVEALVRETLGHSGWSRATHILRQDHFQIYVIHINYIIHISKYTLKYVKLRGHSDWSHAAYILQQDHFQIYH